MIEKEYIERCSAMLGNKKAISHLCFMLTNDDKTGVDFNATIKEMSVMLANAAVEHPQLFIALKVAYKSVKEYLSRQ